MAHTLEIGTRFHSHSDWLARGLIELADGALTDFESERHRESATKAGVCLEGVLKKLFDSWKTPYGERQTFGDLINTARKTGQVPTALLDRLGEANRIRNRAAHHSGEIWEQVNEGDALLMLNVLDMMTTWSSAHIQAAPPSVPADLPIFLSVGSGHRLEQEQFMQHLRTELRSLGVDVRSLNSSDFSENRPFDQVGDIMSRCRGALIVGLERSHAYAVFEREQSKRQKLYADQYIPTAWNQIEGAIASALNLPILVLKDQRLHNEGIFEAENHRHRREAFDVREEAMGLSPRLKDILANWTVHVRTLARQTA